MKVAVSSKGKKIDDDVDKLFGRCQCFLIVQIKDKKIIDVNPIQNSSSEKIGGAGISAAQCIAKENVDAIITGNIGPRAEDVLKQFDIESYRGDGCIKDVLQEFIKGNLKKINEPAIKRKIVIPTDEKKGLVDCVAEHFGRCNTYTFLDEIGNVVEIIDNTSEHNNGVGLPPELMKKHKANILLCRGIGPRALSLCNKFKIDVYVYPAKKVEELFDLWKSNRIKKANSNDVCKEHKV